MCSPIDLPHPRGNSGGLLWWYDDIMIWCYDEMAHGMRGWWTTSNLILETSVPWSRIEHGALAVSWERQHCYNPVFCGALRYAWTVVLITGWNKCFFRQNMCSWSMDRAMCSWHALMIRWHGDMMLWWYGAWTIWWGEEMMNTVEHYIRSQLSLVSNRTRGPGNCFGRATLR